MSVPLIGAPLQFTDVDTKDVDISELL